MTAPGAFEARLVSHIAGADDGALSGEAVTAAVTFMQDSYGVGLSGSRVPLVGAVRRSCLSGRAMDARVWSTGERGDAGSIALLNAYQIHNQEWDCVHEPAVVHPMAVILAVLTAAAERAGGVEGRRLLLATAIAVDVATVLGMCAGQPMRFFRPGWCGGFGAVAGLCVLHGIRDRNLVSNALGLVYSAMGGTMQAHREGSAALPLQIAFNARNAVTAFDLALAGIDGPHQFLSGEFGFFAQVESGDHAEAAFAELGQVVQLTRVSHKPFPTGRAAHGGLDGLLSLRREHGFCAADVASVTVAAPPLVRRLVDRPPRSDMQAGYARLCFPYLAATLLLTGDVDVTDYSPTLIADAERLALAGRVRLVPNGVDDPNALAPQRVSVELLDGRRFDLDLPAVLGSPERPLSATAHREKFLRAAASARRPLDSVQADTLFQAVAALATGGDSRAVSEALVPATEQDLPEGRSP